MLIGDIVFGQQNARIDTIEMEQSIAEWKAAYWLAVVEDSKHLPNLEESLAVSYLHLSEMENGIYSDSRDMDIFPPLHPGASYERKDESKQAIEWRFLLAQRLCLRVEGPFTSRGS